MFFAIRAMIVACACASSACAVGRCEAAFSEAAKGLAEHATLADVPSDTRVVFCCPPHSLHVDVYRGVLSSRRTRDRFVTQGGGTLYALTTASHVHHARTEYHVFLFGLAAVTPHANISISQVSHDSEVIVRSVSRKQWVDLAGYVLLASVMVVIAGLIWRLKVEADRR